MTETQDFLCDNCGVLQPVEDIGYVPLTDKMVCLNRHDCRTRQALHTRLTRENNRRNMSQDITVDPDQYTKKAKRMVVEQIRHNFPIDAMATMPQESDFYVVWFAKTLGNWKALVSTDVVSGHYWEVTYNGAKQETYVDHYIKSANEAFSDMDYHRWITPYSERNYEFRNIPDVSESIKVNRDGQVQLNGRDAYDFSLSGIPRHDGTKMTVQMAIHLAFPDIPMRYVPEV